MQPEFHGVFQIFQVLFIPAHGLPGSVGQFRHRAPVHILQFDDNVQCLYTGVVGYKCSDAEGYLDPLTEIIVEFVGRLDQRGYREDFARKVGRYIASGYIPGVNLFFIYSDSEGNIDSMQITKVIADILGTKRVL